MSFHHEPRAVVIADSVNPDGVRLTTMEVTFHRFILAEVNTHRRLSRNSASSRAIPLETMLQRAVEHPALPLEWPSEKPGMSGGLSLMGDDLIDAQRTLELIRFQTTETLKEYVKRHPEKSTRLHKSILNRPLEWFMWHTAIISSTEWINMFKQRITPDAQPEFFELAWLMSRAINDSEPEDLNYGEWHVPYISDEDKEMLTVEEQVKVSTARCARVSYLTHDGERDYIEDIRMHNDTLWNKGHWSPMEHPAVAVDRKKYPAISSNFDPGWHQYRIFAETGMNVWDDSWED
jgi:hypothetical protein